MIPEYRIYNEINNEMIYINESNYILLIGSEGYEVIEPIIGEFIQVIKKNKDYNKLMLFSQQYDKLERKIYEGDIVLEKKTKFKYKEETDEYIKIIEDRYHLIIDKNGSIDAEFSDFGYEGEDLVDLNQCKIIGNIYQNKELENKLYTI